MSWVSPTTSRRRAAARPETVEAAISRRRAGRHRSGNRIASVMATAHDIDPSVASFGTLSSTAIETAHAQSLGDRCDLVVEPPVKAAFARRRDRMPERGALSIAVN